MLTHEQIELRVEKLTNVLDRYLLNGTYDQKQYDTAIEELAAWAERQYANNPRGHIIS
jgi:hypothetical protein